MYTDTEGVVLRQVKAPGGRRMILLFSKKFGKISAGTSISEKGRSKSALALRPFTYGRYELFKNRDSYNINAVDVIRSYYSMGEDVDKYMAGSYVLEFTDKILVEELPAPKLFNLLTEFFDVMERRKKKFSTLVLAYQYKAMELSGHKPNLRTCAVCGSDAETAYFSVSEGGLVCRKCYAEGAGGRDKALTFNVNLNIMNVLRFFSANPLKSLENLALDDNISEEIARILKCCAEYYLDIGSLKSESFMHDQSLAGLRR